MTKIPETDEDINYDDIPQMTDEQLATMRRCIKLMAEYTSSGVWNKFGVNQDLDSYLLSTGLKRRIEHWCGWYESAWDNDAFPLEQFNETGKKIAIDIKKELPSWEVLYYNEQDTSTYEVMDTEEFVKCARRSGL